MAAQDLQVRFTDEKYATRQDVAKALGTNLIDPIWATILEYRKKNLHHISLSDFSKGQYNLCFCQLINDKVSDINQKNFNYRSVFANLSKESLDYQRIMNSLLANCLKAIAKANNKNIDDVSINNILKHQNIDPQFAYLERYLEAFDRLDGSDIEINDQLLADFYAIVTGNPELSEFYRTEDIEQKQSLIIGREYVGAPVELIESQMESLFNFISRRDLPLFVRVAIVCYVFNYIKPFATYNNEMSMLLCKAMIVNENGESGAYLPIERLLTEKGMVIAALSKEVQKTRDLTYVVDVYLDILKNIIDETSNVFVDHSLEQIKKDFEEEQVEVQKESTYYEPKPVEQPKPVVKPVVREEQPKVHVETFTKVNEQSLSEKELQKLTEELLETDPTLKKGQAHFYIRHREKGHFYTIEQYRKCEGCVYETARTSMDHLAVRGYYRREKVNNKKFVYTPIFKE